MGRLFLTTRIGRRFLVSFLAISLLPIATLGWLAIKRSESALRVQTFAVLRAASDGAEAQLREFLHHLREQVLQVAGEPRVLEGFDSIVYNDRRPPGLSDLDDLLRKEQQSLPDVLEIFILTPDGHIVASSTRTNIGTNAFSADYFQRGQRSFYAGDMFKDPASGQITWVIAA